MHTERMTAAVTRPDSVAGPAPIKTMSPRGDVRAPAAPRVLDAPPVATAPPSASADPKPPVQVDRRRGPRIALKHLLMLTDLVAVALAMVAAAQLTVALRPPTTTGLVTMVLLSLPLWAMIFAQQGLYQARHLTRRIEEHRRLVNAVLAGTFAVAGISVIYGAEVRRAWLVVSAMVVFLTLAAEREAARLIIRHRRTKGIMTRQVVLVGDNAEAHELAAMLEENPELGYDIVGRVIDESESDPDAPDEFDQFDYDIPYLGATDDILDIVRSTGASGVVVATTGISLESANRLIRSLTREGIYVELSSAMRDIATRRVTVRPLGRYPVMCVEPVARRGWRATAKRAFDVVAASVGLVLLSPVLIVSMAAIRITSGRGVIFRQTRVGRHGEPFTVYKLRTMVRNAESMLPELMEQNEASGPMFKMTDDPRVTRVGAILRKMSIDELPQLLNVVKGDMSLVGPRPALPSEALQWNDDLRERLRVQPGITGNWQVNGRFTASIEDYQRLDLFYVDNWSLVTDLVILLKTVPAVLKRNGAV